MKKAQQDKNKLELLCQWDKITEEGGVLFLEFLDSRRRHLRQLLLSDQKAVTIARVLAKKWINKYRVPQEIPSNQRRCFKPEIIQNVCKVYGMSQSCTMPCHQQEVGSANILAALYMTCGEHCRWKRRGGQWITAFSGICL